MAVFGLVALMGAAWGAGPSGSMGAGLAGLSPLSGNASASAASLIPTDPKLRKVHAAPKSGEVRDLEIKELGNFNYDPKVGGNIPADVLALSGLKVRLRGIMAPLVQSDPKKVTDFLLVPSLMNCCFGQPPQIQHTIDCVTADHQPMPYYADQAVIEGTLQVREKKEDGFVTSIFEVTVTDIKPGPKL